MDSLIKGVAVSTLKIIPGVNGNVMHALTCEDFGFKSFGEAYFSSVKMGSVKGWKKHSQMVLNFVVPVGMIRFVIYDDRPGSESLGKYFEITLSPTENYVRLTIEPGLWVAFEGIGDKENILLNVASIRHDPTEGESRELNAGPMKYPYTL